MEVGEPGVVVGDIGGARTVADIEEAHRGRRRWGNSIAQFGQLVVWAATGC
jgi:hypothetical protein